MKKTVFGLALSVLLVLLSGCSESILDSVGRETSARDDEATPNFNMTASDALRLTATHGLRRKITLSWNAVPDAYTYKIYSDETPYGEFSLLQKTLRAKIQQPIKVLQDDGTTKDDPTGKKEIVNNTEDTLMVEESTDIYYIVKAFDKEGNLMVQSASCHGTSLAKVTLTVDSSEESQVVTWFADNCTERTYKSLMMYEITCYEDAECTKVADLGAGQESVIVKKATDPDANTATFNNLLNGNKYHYKVTSYLSSAPESTEISEVMDAETSQAVTPSAVTDLSATKGLSTSWIKLSFKLPGLTNIKTKEGKFEAKPLYFIIERRSEGSREYTPIVQYLGVYKGSEEKDKTEAAKKGLKAGEYRFNCAVASTASEDLSQVVKMGATAEEDAANFEITRGNTTNNEMFKQFVSEFVPGATVTYIDTGATVADPDAKLRRDANYEYRVRSFTDQGEKYDKKASVVEGKSAQITGADSGFLIAASTLEVKGIPTFEKNADGTLSTTKISSWEVNIKSNYDDKGLSFSYALARRRTPFPTQDAPNPAAGEWELVTHTYDLATIQNYHDKDRDENGQEKFNFEGKDEETLKTTVFGNYAYKLLILGSTVTAEKATKAIENDTLTSDDENKVLYEVIKTASNVPIANSSEYIPTIKAFNAESGYRDKFVLYFDYKPGFTYFLRAEDSADAFTAEDTAVGNAIITSEGKLISWDKVGTNSEGRELTSDDYSNTWTLKTKDKDGKEISIVEGGPTDKGDSFLEGRKVLRYEVPAASGTKKSFKLTVRNGIDVSAVVTDVKTLGTPAPYQYSWYYDRIVVRWKMVQEANVGEGDIADNAAVSTGFVVKYQYKPADSATDEVKNTWVTSNLAIKKISGKGEDMVFECVIDKPAGYNDYTKAGLAINVCVTAKSKIVDVKNDTATTAIMRVVGPALMATQVEVPTITGNVQTMGLSWLPVEGPEDMSYGVYRARYSDLDATTLATENGDDGGEAKHTYNFQKSNSPSAVPCEDAATSLASGRVTFTDTSVASIATADKDNAYKKEQYNIVLGRPYAYIAVPLIGYKGMTGTFEEPKFAVKDNAIEVTVGGDNTGKVTYTNVTPLVNATLGFGLKVTASKLTSDRQITVKWTRPYWAALSAKDPKTLSNERKTVLAKLAANPYYNKPAVYFRRTHGRAEDRHWNSSGDSLTNTVASWTKAYSINNGSDAELQAATYAQDFFVTYGQQNTLTSNGACPIDNAAAYTEYLAKFIDTTPGLNYPKVGGVPLTEPANKGYTKAVYFNPVPGPSAPAGYDVDTRFYSEYISLGWDYEDRVLGPTLFKLYMMNYNIDGAWHEVCQAERSSTAVMVGESRVLGLQKKVVADAPHLEDVTKEFAFSVAKDGVTYNGVWLTPSAILAQARYEDKDNHLLAGRTKDGFGNTSNVRGGGLLKVLRDARHFYKLEATFEGKDEPEVYGLNTDNVTPMRYTYRNITDEELAKATLLTLAYWTKDVNGSHTTGTSGMGTGESADYASIDAKYFETGSVAWSQNMASKLRLKINNAVCKWESTAIPAGKQVISSIALSHTSDELSGRKTAGTWWYISSNQDCDGGGKPNYDNNKLLQIGTTPYGNFPDSIKASYTSNVGVAIDGSNDEIQMHVQVTHGETLTLNYAFVTDWELTGWGIFGATKHIKSTWINLTEGNTTTKIDCAKYTKDKNDDEWRHHNGIISTYFAPWFPGSIGERGWSGNNSDWGKACGWWPVEGDTPPSL